MTDSIFYVVEIELPMADLPEFVDWYAAVHAPHLFNAGFNNCTSYLAVAGGMSVVDVYQADDWSMFEAPRFDRYRGLVFKDPYRPKVLGTIPNGRAVYVHRDVPGVTVADPAAALDADWLSIWRFPGGTETEDRVAAWLAGGGGAALGARTLRLLRRGKDAPTGASRRPSLALTAEWDARPPAPAETASVLPDWLASQVAPGELFTGLRLYPWAGDPALRAEAIRRVANGGSLP